MNVVEGAEAEGHLAAPCCRANPRDPLEWSWGKRQRGCWSVAPKLSHIWVNQGNCSISLALGSSLQPSNMLKPHSTCTKPSCTPSQLLSYLSAPLQSQSSGKSLPLLSLWSHLNNSQPIVKVDLPHSSVGSNTIRILGDLTHSSPVHYTLTTPSSLFSELPTSLLPYSQDRPGPPIQYLYN